MRTKKSCRSASADIRDSGSADWQHWLLKTINCAFAAMSARSVGFTGDCYLNGQTECFPLEDDTTIRLRHELFDEDAIVLKNMARCVSSWLPEKTGNR